MPWKKDDLATLHRKRWEGNDSLKEQTIKQIKSDETTFRERGVRLNSKSDLEDAATCRQILAEEYNDFALLWTYGVGVSAALPTPSTDKLIADLLNPKTPIYIVE